MPWEGPERAWELPNMARRRGRRADIEAAIMPSPISIVDQITMGATPSVGVVSGWGL